MLPSVNCEVESIDFQRRGVISRKMLITKRNRMSTCRDMSTIPEYFLSFQLNLSVLAFRSENCSLLLLMYSWNCTNIIKYDAKAETNFTANYYKSQEMFCFSFVLFTHSKLHRPVHGKKSTWKCWRYVEYLLW